MARKLRRNSKTGAQHIALKGHDSRIVFHDDEDRQDFLNSLSNACKKYKINILEYCLMDNHVHLVLHGQIDLMGKVFQSLGASFGQRHNRKYQREGSVWKSRYFSNPIDSFKELALVAAYIYNNPIAAGLTQTQAAYRWSSYKYLDCKNAQIVNNKALDDLVSIDEIKLITAEHAYSKYGIYDGMKDVFPRPRLLDTKVQDIASAFLKKKRLSVSIEAITSIKEKFQNELIKKLFKAGSNCSQIARVTGLSKRKIASFA